MVHRLLIFYFITFTMLTFGAMSKATNWDFQYHASKKYNSLMENLSTIASIENVFWQIGRALDPMIYFVREDKDALKNLGETAAGIFQQKINSGQTWWWDDYGWWGYAFLHLYSLTKDISYLNLTTTCFNNMLAAKNAWSLCNSGFKFAQTPRYNWGCYNTNLSNQGDPLVGIQNTVTNAQYLRLALGLFLIHYSSFIKTKNENDALLSEVYWFLAMEQYRWFLNWFKESLLVSSFAGPHHMLIEERVSKYFDGTKAIAYVPNRFWTGDQGLMMTIFTQLTLVQNLLRKKNPLSLSLTLLDDKLADKTVYLAKGVKKQLVDNNNTLLPYAMEGIDDFPFYDPSDYSTGTGVYFAAITRCAPHNEVLKQHFHGDAYQLILSKNANDALSRLENIQNIDDFHQVASDLAALSAAINLLKP
jgi:hypothetical protein